MPSTWTKAVTLALVTAAATVLAAQSTPTDVPVRTPADEIATFSLPDGYRVELVAAEPLVQDPVLIEWDADGRLWVVEMPGYMSDIRASDEHAPTGRVVVLEDTDGDGTMDRRTVFADQLVLPRALKVLADGVLVAEPPYLWLMRDTTGDLVADTRTLVTDRYGRREAVVEHNLNSLTWALDNWMHTAEGTIYLRFRSGGFEVRPTLSRGQWGVTQDDVGRLYRNTNESALHVDVVPTPYYARHPDLVRTRGSYESLEGLDEAVNLVWPVRPTPGVNRGYQAGVLREDQRLARFTAVAAPTVYRGDRLPADLSGNVFVVEPAGNLVSRIIVEDGPGGLSARKAYEGREFIASTDERFRPVNLSSAPDGTLYVVDMYRGIIQHKAYITEYLRDYIQSRRVERPVSLGRIFRVVHDSTRRGPRPALSRASTATLLSTLSHPNGWWRDMAQQRLVQRGDLTAGPALAQLARSAAPVRTRLHALWTLDGLDAMSPELVVQAMNDPARDIRVAGIRLAERFVGRPDVQAALVARLDDADWAVRAQLAATLGELPGGVRERALADLLARAGDQPIVVDAALSGMRDAELGVLDRLLDGSDSPARRAAITMVAATIVRRKANAPIQQVWAWTAMSERAAWQRAALLEGAEVALAGAPPPGTVRRSPPAQAAAVPCPTCPGGRGGPGGARAFPDVLGEGTAAAPSRGSGPVLTLASEPALARLPATDPLAARAAGVLARVAWPGRLGADSTARPAVALTTADQSRIADGRAVYESVCSGCHQANGRGLERVAPPLVDSPVALGPIPVLARILLHGKEGSVGLMPSLGGTLDDDQMAAVLSYVRHDWGHAASMVVPGDIAAARRDSAGRTRPWTTSELDAAAR